MQRLTAEHDSEVVITQAYGPHCERIDVGSQALSPFSLNMWILSLLEVLHGVQPHCFLRVGHFYVQPDRLPMVKGVLPLCVACKPSGNRPLGAFQRSGGHISRRMLERHSPVSCLE